MTLIPSSSKDWAAGFSSKGFPSLTVTIAPSLSKRRAADSPDLAKPNTKTFLLANFEIVFIMYLFIHTTFYFTFFCENKKVISGFYFNCYQLLINKKKYYSIEIFGKHVYISKNYPKHLITSALSNLTSSLMINSIQKN